MKGKIYEINWDAEMVAVITEYGDYSIFKFLGGDPAEVGDSIQWEGDTPLGSEKLTNITQLESYEVYFQNHHVLKHQIREQLLHG